MTIGGDRTFCVTLVGGKCRDSRVLREGEVTGMIHKGSPDNCVIYVSFRNSETEVSHAKSLNETLFLDVLFLKIIAILTDRPTNLAASSERVVKSTG